MAAPMTKVTRGKVKKYHWGNEQKKAFEVLKEALSKASVLRLINPSLPFTARTDASDAGLGAVLQQEHGDCFYPMALLSRKL